MRLILVKIFNLIITILDKFFSIFSKKFLFRGYLYQELREKFKNINIEGHSIKIYIPSNLSEWRASNVEEKEPETIEWIKNFDINLDGRIIFWDIGANIGLYSLFAAKFHNSKINIIAFEPSVLNLNLLARNIYENDLNNCISINQIPITNKKKNFY